MAETVARNAKISILFEPNTEETVKGLERVESAYGDVEKAAEKSAASVVESEGKARREIDKTTATAQAQSQAMAKVTDSVEAKSKQKPITEKQLQSFQTRAAKLYARIQERGGDALAQQILGGSVGSSAATAPAPPPPPAAAATSTPGPVATTPATAPPPPPAAAVAAQVYTTTPASSAATAPVPNAYQAGIASHDAFKRHIREQEEKRRAEAAAKATAPAPDLPESVTASAATPTPNVVKRIVTGAKGKVEGLYKSLSDQYGKNWAKAIIGAGALGLPLPIPFSSALTAAPVLAAAKFAKWRRNRAATATEAGSSTSSAPPRASRAAPGGIDLGGGVGGVLGQGGALLKAGAAFLGIQALQSMAQSGANIATTANRGDLTGEQRQRGIVEAIPIVGSLVRSFRELRDAVNGTTERLRRIDANAKNVETETAIRQEGRMRLEPMEREQAFEANRMRGYGNATTYTARQGDRSTLAGEQRYQEAYRQAPARQEALRAQVEAGIARANQRTTEQRLARTTDARDRASDRVQATTANVRQLQNTPHTQEQWARALHEQKQALQELANLEQQRQAQVEAGSNAVRAAAQAEATARRANIGVIRAEIAALEAKEERIKSNSTRLGALGRVDRQLGLQAARNIRDRGLQNVTPEQQALAERVAPEYVQQQRQRFGENTQEYRALREEGFLGADTETVQAVREQIGRLNARVEVTINTDNQELSRFLLEGIDPSLRRFAEGIETNVRVGIERNWVDNQMRNRTENR